MGTKDAFNLNLGDHIEPFRGVWLVTAIEEIDDSNVAVTVSMDTAVAWASNAPPTVRLQIPRSETVNIHD